MNEVKHTPGPWIVGQANNIYTGTCEPESMIAAVRFLGGDNAEGDANARLIVAAPDLLAALHGLMDMYGIEPARSKSGTWKRALDAVARAERKP